LRRSLVKGKEKWKGTGLSFFLPSNIELKAFKSVTTWANGDYYDGEFKENAAEGYGVWVSSDGTKYEGEWKSNMVCNLPL